MGCTPSTIPEDPNAAEPLSEEPVKPEPVDDPLDYAKTPASVSRGCTDVPCLLLFLGCLAAYGYILNYANQHGEDATFAGLPNYNQSLCGVSEGEKTKPFLFFCTENDSSDTIANKGGLCLEKCPTDTSQSLKCPKDLKWLDEHGRPQEPFKKKGEMVVEADWEKKWRYHTLKTYPTYPFAGMVCMPKDPQKLRKVMEEMKKDEPLVEFILEAMDINHAWAPIITALIVSIGIAVAYIFLLEWFAQCLIWTGLGSAILVCGGGGVYMLMLAASGGEDAKAGVIIPGNVAVDWALGVGGLLFAVFFVLAAVAARKSVRLATECIRAACTCVRNNPTLFVHPLLCLVLQFTVVYYMVWNLAYLVSCGLRFSHRPNADGTKALSTAFNPTPQEMLMMIFYILTSVWILEFTDAVWRFVVTYVTQVWFLDKQAVASGSEEREAPPCCLTPKAYLVALTQNFGSLAAGSLIISWARPFRVIMNVVTAMANDSSAIGKMFNVVCFPCVACHRATFRPLHKNAYMDVALNSNSFCTSAGHALDVITYQRKNFAALRTAATLIKVSGLGLIIGVAFFVTEVRINMSSSYTTEGGRYYLAYPMLVCCFSTFVSVLASLPIFLLVSDVSDSILFASSITARRTGDFQASKNPEILALVAAVKAEAEEEKKTYGEDEDGVTFERLLA